MPVVVRTAQRATRTAEEPLEEYACSDGKVPMESAPHANATVTMHSQLQGRFEARPDVCAAGGMVGCWRQGLLRNAACRQARTLAPRRI